MQIISLLGPTKGYWHGPCRTDSSLLAACKGYTAPQGCRSRLTQSSAMTCKSVRNRQCVNSGNNQAHGIMLSCIIYLINSQVVRQGIASNLLCKARVVFRPAAPHRRHRTGTYSGQT